MHIEKTIYNIIVFKKAAVTPGTETTSYIYSQMLSKQNLKPDTIKLLSFNVRGLSNFIIKKSNIFLVHIAKS